MSVTNTGGPAFPCMPPQDTAAGVAVGYPFPDQGMSVRDLASLLFHAALLSNPAHASLVHSHGERALVVDAAVDAFLQARQS